MNINNEKNINNNVYKYLDSKFEIKKIEKERL